MSKVALSGNASGTGTFTIASPNSNVDRTLSLPDQTATLITNSADVLNIGSGQFYKDASGNVGIGTSSPFFPLDVAGAIRGNSWIGRTNVSAPTADCAIYRAADNTLGFSTANTERARIDSSGNFMVGTTSAIGSGKLSVYYTSASNQGIALNEASGTSGAIAIRFYSVSTQVGTITTTTSSTAYNTSSDYRLKENVQPMTGALSVVQQLKPCTYKWKSDGSDGQGFIAHELAEVCPQAVTGEKDAVNEDGSIKPQGIDTSFLTATLTAAIQELKVIVDAQGAEIAALKGTA